jgi:hypothetical protein
MLYSSPSARSSFTYKLIFTCFQFIVKDAWSLIFGGTVAEQNIITIQLGKNVKYCYQYAHQIGLLVFPYPEYSRNYFGSVDHCRVW